MRPIILWLLTIAIVFSIAFMANETITKINNSHKVKKKIIVLKSLPLVTLDSTSYILKRTPLLIIFFTTTCEHCQYEMAQIKKSIHAFNQINVLMVSSEPIKDIRKFSIEFGLNDLPTVTFTKIRPEDVYDTFGSVSIPHVFIYSKDHELIKDFKGETKIEAILKYLP